MFVRLRLPLLLALFAVSASAHAEQPRLIDGPRILLSDIVRAAPEELAETDLGPAPPPGGSRVVSRQDVEQALVRAGAPREKLAIPKLTRVESRSERLSPEDIIARVSPKVEAVLPPDVELEKLSTSRSLVLSPRAEFGAVRLPKLPKREGAVKTTLTVEILTPGASPLLVPLTANLRLGPGATTYAVPRGAEVTAIIERGPTRIGAIAVALADADVDEVVLLQIVKTRKLIKARIESKSTARVVSE
jgi:hypothetical protein